MGTQGSVGGVAGGLFYFKTHFTKHFWPTPRAWGIKLKRRKVKEEKDLPACRGAGQRGGGHSTHALRPLPTTPPDGFFFPRLHLGWEGSKDLVKEIGQVKRERGEGGKKQEESKPC